MIYRVFYVVGALVVLSGCGKSEPNKPDEAGAYFKCKDSVNLRLKSPSTAEFSSINDSTITIIKVGRSGDKDEIQFKVVGYVDAQNGFGGTVRNKFACNISGKTGDLWRTDSVSLK